MLVTTTYIMRQDRGALGPKPSALVVAVGVGPEGRILHYLAYDAMFVCIAVFGCYSLLGCKRTY